MAGELCGHCRCPGPEFLCSRCRSAKFCGSECFRAAWRQHKATCRGPAPPQTEEVPGATAVLAAPVPDAGPAVAVIVPFREQLPLQDRVTQLRRFLPHMAAFLGGACRWRVVVVQQSQDGRKFNRGMLLNVGFRLAQQLLPDLGAAIMHDVDLLPSKDMLAVYVRPPPESCAVHLASVWSMLSSKELLMNGFFVSHLLGTDSWPRVDRLRPLSLACLPLRKYSYASFIGGVLSLRPDDFERMNGYPNNYWGWGLEDDQLALRMAHHGVRTLRVRAGSFEDLDPVNMKEVLEGGRSQPERQGPRQRLPSRSKRAALLPMLLQPREGFVNQKTR